MNNQENSFVSASSKKISSLQVNLDEFQIDEDVFKPMTKGLGFHQETRRSAFTTVANALPVNSSRSAPSGLEVFYGKSAISFPKEEKGEEEKQKEIKKRNQTAPHLLQFFAWFVDLFVILSFVALTFSFLILASRIEFSLLLRLLSPKDLAIFVSAIFSIYYLLYFTILDLTGSPGKTIFLLRLEKVDEGQLMMKHTFFRALVSLLSGVALFLPMLLDFQGRLSETRVVK